MNPNPNYHLDAQSIANALQKAKRAGTGKYAACCPAHDDRTPSLSIKDALDGKVLVHCHAGCSQEEVFNALRDLGLWHTASKYQRNRHIRRELKETIRHHQQILLLGVGQTKGLSGEDQAQMKESIRFLKEHSHG